MKNLMKLIGLILGGLIAISTSAQEAEQCGQKAYLEYLEELQPGINAHIDETFFKALSESSLKTKNTQDTIHTIQVVFHVVYNSNAENLDDELIYSQLRILNECFNRTNPDTVNTRDVFVPLAADAGIQFLLATVDPDGNTTDGIVRESTDLNSFSNSQINLAYSDQVKFAEYGSVAWDTEKYLNIWVCDLSSNGFDALLGYAYPPTNAPNWTNSNSFSTSDRQGVVVHYKVVGEDNPQSLATGSKTLIHEVGHYLGLRHIWGDGGCGVDDFMDDTPRAKRASNGCTKGVNTCAEPTGEQYPDMLENYMDYSTGECQNMFTHDQVAQMRANLTAFRSEIYTTQRPNPPTLELVDIETGIHPKPVINDMTVYLAEANDSNDLSFALIIVNMLGQQVYKIDLQNQPVQILSGFAGLKGAYIYIISENKNTIQSGKIIFGY